MKTLKLKNEILRNLILAAGLMVITTNAFADGDSVATCPNAKANSSDLKKVISAEMLTPSVMRPASMNMTWMIEEFEEELEVLDIEATYEMRPIWNVEAFEFELLVEEYKPTEEVIPYWMIIEVEPELEIADLVLN